ncbi:MAG: Flp pilus assembly complex ATPase component TadA [Gemmatimonadaceae bacterium]|nr:Flp pilus assembly complex ATPase component TadA [Gemmatimonadaceae bacterium]
MIANDIDPLWEALATATGVAASELSATFATPWAAMDAYGADEDACVAAAAQRAGVSAAIDSGDSAQATALLPERWARRYGVAPLAASDSWIEVATSTPHDPECERAIGFATGRTVRFALASPRRIAEWTARAYADEADRPDREDLRPASMASELQHLTPDNDGAPGGGASRRGGDDVMRLVDRLLSEGIRAGASDVHVEPEEQGVVVRHRIDGVLRDATTLPRDIGPALASRVKILSGLDIAVRLRPQDGRARVAVGGQTLDLRVSTLPASHGEKIVVRILDASGAERTLDAMGFASVERARVQRLLEAREGLILVTGPTGSGKTTTLYAALREVRERGVNIVTVEDPIEYRIPGIVQVQVRERSGLTFAAALRSIMRQDPDVILVGEIRDRETAEIALQASLTGHLVLSTLHTNDAASAATRLADMGIPAIKVATALKGIIAQRLLRRVCPACMRQEPAGDPQPRFRIARGTLLPIAGTCDACAQSGFSGRLAIVEVLLATPDVERAIASGAPAESVAAVARSGGMQSLWESGVARVIEGATTLDELLRVAEPPAAPTPGRAPGATVPPPGYDGPRSLHSPRDAESPVPWSVEAARMPAAEGAGVTDIKVGTIDVYVIRPQPGGWRVLVMQRATDTRCPTAWEAVHGRLEEGEEPEDGAIRELREETGLVAERLYVVTTQPYYIKAMRSVQLSIGFAAFVATDADVKLGAEHQAYEWLTVAEALARFAWPRERQALEEVVTLVGPGDAGAVEDVLRIF